jgi:ribonucleoside-diphosphate reductase alpha chain
VPLQDLVDKFGHVRFEPSGMTRNPDIRFAKSIVDYIFRWLAAKFLSAEAQYNAGLNVPAVTTTPEQLVLDVKQTGKTAELSVPAAPSSVASAANQGLKFAAMQNQEDAPPCSTCGSIMVRSGACYKCANCGTTSGCA